MEDIIILWEEESTKVVSDEAILESAKPDVEQKRSFMEYLNDVVAWFQKIKIKEKIVFYRLMATMLNAWMSLVKWVSVLEKQEKNPVFKKVLGEMVVWLKEWKNLSECMEQYPTSFDDSELWVIRAGEKTWKLNEVMTSLADQVEKVASVAGKMKSALIYPAMIMLVVVWVIVVMMTMVVPKLLEIFDDKSALPASTKILIFISDLFVNYWYIIIICVVVLFFAIQIWKKTPTGKYNYDKFVLWLMASWVSVVESLKIVSDAVWNEVYRQRILLLLEDVRQWMKMWESLEGDPLFPDIMTQMIQVWEQSAKLDTVVIKVADFYDEQVDNTAATINKLLEPFIIVFLAVVVWFIAIAIMQPIMNLADTVAQS